MNTTNLLVDILIVGIQVLTWILGLVFTFVIDPTKFTLKYESPLMILLLISIAYILGVVFDYIIAIAFGKFKSKEEIEVYKNISTIEMSEKIPTAHKYLENQYARLRIARSTLINIPVITLTSVIFILVNKFENLFLPYGLISISIVGVTLTILSYFSWKKRNSTYINYLIQAKKLIKSNEV